MQKQKTKTDTFFDILSKVSFIVAILSLFLIHVMQKEAGQICQKYCNDVYNTVQFEYHVGECRCYYVAENNTSQLQNEINILSQQKQ